MKGVRFTQFVPVTDPQKNTFENLLSLFLQLISMTGGDVSEALSWLSNLDKRYQLTEPNYGIGDFIEDLKSKGYLSEDDDDEHHEDESALAFILRGLRQLGLVANQSKFRALFTKQEQADAAKLLKK